MKTNTLREKQSTERAGGTYEMRSVRTASNHIPKAATQSRTEKQKGNFAHAIKSFFTFTVKALQFLASIASVLLLIYLLLQLGSFASKLKTVFALQNIIGNLKASVPIVSIQLVDAEMQKTGSPFTGEKIKADGSKTFKVSYFNANGELEADEPASITIEGKNIYVDCIVYNFTYSLIETGEAQNIAIPYRIYSDTVAPESGILLHATNKQDIPFTLLQSTELGSEEFYTLQNERLKKLMEVINNPEKAKALGIIRTRQKAAVANYNTMHIGSTYTVTVENTGGVTLRSK